MPFSNNLNNEGVLSLYEPAHETQKKKPQIETIKSSKKVAIGPYLFVCDQNLPSIETDLTDPSEKLRQINHRDGDELIVQNDERRAVKKSRIVYASSEVNLSKYSSLANDNVETIAPFNNQNCRTKALSTSASAPSLVNLELFETKQESNQHIVKSQNPEIYLREILREKTGKAMKNHAALGLNNFFLDMTEENIKAYTEDIVSAVRRQDVATIRKKFDAGQILQCCNQFGESVLHMACRRGAFEIVRFMVEEAGVSFLVRDDYGRTPLHDACWTREPNTNLVKLIVSKNPDLLLISDKRGFTPLSYVRPNDWVVWCKFLDENRDILIPALL